MEVEPAFEERVESARYEIERSFTHALERVYGKLARAKSHILILELADTHRVRVAGKMGVELEAERRRVTILESQKGQLIGELKERDGRIDARERELAIVRDRIVQLEGELIDARRPNIDEEPSS